MIKHGRVLVRVLGEELFQAQTGSKQTLNNMREMHFEALKLIGTLPRMLGYVIEGDVFMHQQDQWLKLNDLSIVTS